MCNESFHSLALKVMILRTLKKKKICSPNQIFEPLFNLQLSWTMNPFSSSKILPLILIFCLPFLGLNKNPIFEKSALYLFLANQCASE